MHEAPLYADSRVGGLPATRPGFMPSGTPAIPKISISMDSRPGLAAGTLHTSSGRSGTQFAFLALSKCSYQVDFLRCDIELVYLITVGCKALCCIEFLVAFWALEMFGFLVLYKGCFIVELSITVVAPRLYLVFFLLFAHDCAVPSTPSTSIGCGYY